MVIDIAGVDNDGVVYLSYCVFVCMQFFHVTYATNVQVNK